MPLTIYRHNNTWLRRPSGWAISANCCCDGTVEFCPCASIPRPELFLHNPRITGGVATLTYNAGTEIWENLSVEFLDHLGETHNWVLYMTCTAPGFVSFEGSTLPPTAETITGSGPDSLTCSPFFASFTVSSGPNGRMVDDVFTIEES